MEETRNGIITRKVEDEMRDSYLQYAMSVIVARALPDVRDGLKPVHRRILHAMNELGLDPGKGYKKCARIVGETMGKYHPHGESSIYDALVRMAQDFSMRYVLVDGHGNFGSMDGDSAAAQRYTEARLGRLSAEMLADIEKDTVDFTDNYDGEDKEPVVLPSRFPNLLVNGSSGIAVGMATNIPPHNLTECINAVVKLIDDQIAGVETTPSDLLDIVKGPDFPTGATILGTTGVKQALLTGRGRVVVRAEVEIEPMSGGKEMIVVRSLPYQVNKAKLVEHIAELVKEKKVDGITDLRDESDREGIRVVMELRKDANSGIVLNNLYKYSQLQDVFSVNTVALVNGRPKTLGLMSLLTEYLKHQKDVVTRRTRFELEKAEARAHILQGLIIALDNIDEVINIIRSSREAVEAVSRLMERFGLTKIQSEAIVDMRLRRLTGLEREKLEEEFRVLTAEIARLKGILADDKELVNVIKTEILRIRDKYGDERRTKIVPFEGELEIEDLIDDEGVVITMTNLDYIKRLPLTTYKTQSRGGKGVMGLTTREEDVIKNLFIANTHDDVLFFTTLGKVYTLKAYAIPEAGRQAKGTAAVNLLQLSGGERVAAVMPVRDYDGFIMLATRDGVVKKTALENFSNVRKTGITALTIREGDELIAVMRTKGDDNIFLATRNGMGIRFNEGDVRAVGRTAAGVIGIRMDETDAVIGAEVVTDGQKILIVSVKGYGKRTEDAEFRIQSRGGKGVTVYKANEKTGLVVGAAVVEDSDELMLINSEGNVIRIKVDNIRETGRAASGVRLIRNDEDVTVVSIAKITGDNVSENAEKETEKDAEQGTEQDTD